MIMSEVRDFTTQTDIPHISVMNREDFDQHLKRIKFDLKRLVMLSYMFDSSMNDLADRIIGSIFYMIKDEKIEMCLNKAKQKVNEIESQCSSYRAAIMKSVNGYSMNLDELFIVTDSTPTYWYSKFLSKSILEMNAKANEIVRTGEKRKDDLRLIISVIELYESIQYEIDSDELEECYNQLLMFTAEKCKEENPQVEFDIKHFPQILFSIKEGIQLTADATNYTGKAITRSESDPSLKNVSLEDLNIHTQANMNEEIQLTHERLTILKKRSREMAQISKAIDGLREKLKQSLLT